MFQRTVLERVSPTSHRSLPQGLRVLNSLLNISNNFWASHAMPPPVLVGPVLRFLQSKKQACTIVVLDSYPRKYWCHYYTIMQIKHLKWLLLEMVMYSLYLRLKFGHHIPEFRAIFWYSRLSFQRISFYEPGLIPFVGIISLQISIPVYISLIISVLFGRSSLWWQNYVLRTLCTLSCLW